MLHRDYYPKNRTCFNLSEESIDFPRMEDYTNVHVYMNTCTFRKKCENLQLNSHLVSHHSRVSPVSRCPPC